MVDAVVVIVFLNLCVLMAAALAVMTTRDRLVRRRMRDDVIVTLRTGEAFRGILHDADHRSFILRDAKALTDSTARPVPVDGELILDRGQIDYFQRPG